MRRREFMTFVGGAMGALTALTPPVGHAQDRAKLWRLGIILAKNRTPAIEGFVQGMREHGYQAGRDYYSEWRFADGRFARFPDFARDLVRLQVDVIFVETDAAVDLVRQVTRTIPIVMGYSLDPVGSGLVASLTRPGANVTGMTGSRESTLPRQFELLRTALPSLSRVAILLNPESGDYSGVLASAQDSARKSGTTLISGDARNLDGISKSFAQFSDQRIEAVIVADDAYFLARREQLAGLALKNRLLSIFPKRDYVVAGGLMSYGENLAEFYRRAASFVDRILKGAKPTELPIERAAPQLAINRRTAAALALPIPARVYALADEIIE